MLMKITTDKVQLHWEAIQLMLKESMQETEAIEVDDSQILQQLLVGNMVCWIIFRHNSKPPHDILGMVITEVLDQQLIGMKSLLIYAFGVWEVVKNSEWIANFKQIKEYAIGEGCKRVVGYTKNPRVLQMADMVNGSSIYRYITIPF